MDHSYSAQLEQKVQYQAADLALQADEIEWSAHYRALLESKLEEAGLSPPKLQIGLVEAGLKTTRKQQTKTSKDKGYQPSFFTSAIAQSQNEARNVKDMLAKVREGWMYIFSCYLFFPRSPFLQMEKRALAAEERAAEAVVVERKARAALDARGKQMASMRLRVSDWNIVWLLLSYPHIRIPNHIKYLNIKKCAHTTDGHFSPS